MRRTVALLFTAMVIGSIWLGCTVWNDAVLPMLDAGAPVPTADGPTGCARMTVPDIAPTSVQPSSGPDNDVVVATRTISLGVMDKGVDPKFGFDLDGVCTCTPDEESCKPRAGTKKHCDGELGRDNGTGLVIAELGSGLSITALVNRAFTENDIGIIARVQGYNGQKDDAEILFSLYRSSGVPGGKDARPRFDDPNQAWKINKTDLNAQGEKYATSNSSTGFVKGGRMVVPRFASSKIPLTSDADIRLVEVSLTAELVFDAAIKRWRFKDGIITGRWPVSDALANFARLGFFGTPVCKNAALMKQAKDSICANADLTTILSQDGKNQPCNALSTMIGFETAPAVLGDIEEPTTVDECQDAGVPMSCD